MTQPCYSISPIGFVQSPYKQKFGVARQPGLVPAAQIVIELLPQFDAHCVRGLAEFDYVWVQFVFHAVLDEGWSPLVRPPRLGGKQKMGVFATRSPHRPNHLGLSLLKLEHISTNKIVRLHLSGADLLDATPVVDIKPYIPFVEAKADARSGFVHGTPPTIQVVWQPKAMAAFQAAALNDDFRHLLEQSIAQDPRPAYQDVAERIYVMRLAQFDVFFQIQNQQAFVLDLCEHKADIKNKQNNKV